MLKLDLHHGEHLLVDGELGGLFAVESLERLGGLFEEVVVDVEFLPLWVNLISDLLGKRNHKLILIVRGTKLQISLNIYHFQPGN